MIRILTRGLDASIVERMGALLNPLARQRSR
jgi:hypothetical protein